MTDRAPQLPPTGGRLRTVAGGALVKYAAEAVALACSFVTGVVTARNLGPGGKGDLAAMGYLAVICGTAASLGLGEAGVHALYGRGRSLRQVVGTTFAVLIASVAAGALAYAGAAALQLSFHEGLTTAIVLTGLSVPAIAVIGAIAPLVDARHRFADTAAARVAGAGITAALTTLLVVGTDDGLDGAAMAALVGWWIVPFVLLRPLAAERALARPSFDRQPIAAALRLGVPIQLSQLLMTATARVDLLAVYAIAEDGVAGEYSVALTLGSLNTFAALAIASASFGRIAATPDRELREYVGFTTRVAIIVAVAVGAVIAPVLPWLVPRAFGHGFRGAVGPSIVLLAGGVLWSAQWVLCRGAAARGRGSVLVASYGTTLVTMLVGDVLLVPDGEAMGAAIASVVSSALGLLVALVGTRRQLGVTAGDLLPRRADLRSLRSAISRR